MPNGEEHQYGELMRARHQAAEARNRVAQKLDKALEAVSASRLAGRLLGGGSVPYIPGIEWVLLILAAALIDGGQFLLNFVPLIGNTFAEFLTPAAGFLFAAWAFFRRIPRGLLGVGVTSVIELIPLFNSLPTWIAYVVAMFILYGALRKTQELLGSTEG